MLFRKKSTKRNHEKRRDDNQKGRKKGKLGKILGGLTVTITCLVAKTIQTI